MTSAPTRAALEALAASPIAASVEEGASLAAFTTYRVGGPAAGLVRIGSVEDLEVLGGIVAATGVATLAIGKGSNLLVADDGFDGLVLQLDPDAFSAIDIDGTSVRAGAAALLPVVARRTVQHGLTDFEWAVGVPGTVGGAVRMNAGGHGSDVAASLRSVTVYDVEVGRRLERSAADLDLGYRTSSLGAADLVLDAVFDLSPGDRERSERTLAEIVRWRRSHQPGGPNAGSVFTNPPGDSAGRLIDAAGLKGYRIGTAEVSTKHANFIQADPGGSAADVLALIRHVQDVVAATAGVSLHPENRLIGFDERSSPAPAQSDETVHPR